jgi:hypothetical protein
MIIRKEHEADYPRPGEKMKLLVTPRDLNIRRAVRPEFLDVKGLIVTVAPRREPGNMGNEETETSVRFFLPPDVLLNAPRYANPYHDWTPFFSKNWEPARATARAHL